MGAMSTWRRVRRTSSIPPPPLAAAAATSAAASSDASDRSAGGAEAGGPPPTTRPPPPHPHARPPVGAGGEPLDPPVLEPGRRRSAVFGEHLGEAPAVPR